MWLANDTSSLTIGPTKAPRGKGVDIAAATDWSLFRQPVQFQWCADNPVTFGRSQSHAVWQHEPKPHGVLLLPLIKSCLDCTSAVGPSTKESVFGAESRYLLMGRLCPCCRSLVTFYCPWQSPVELGFASFPIKSFCRIFPEHMPRHNS